MTLHVPTSRHNWTSRRTRLSSTRPYTSDQPAPFVLVDTRDLHAWNQGHARGAVHIPKATFGDVIQRDYPAGTEFVVYCWGPGCNGATRAALTLTTLGFAARVMIGGFEYWAREGLPVDGKDGDLTRPADPLTAPVGHDSAILRCDC